MKSKKHLLIVFIVICFTKNTNAQHYEHLGQGLLGGTPAVRCLYADTVADLLYVSGGFSNGGGIGAHGIASWNGVNWDTLGRGFDNYPIPVNFPGWALAMCRYNNELYIGGSFGHAGTTNAHSLAHWDGNSWYALPSETNGVVYGMMEYNSELYISGVFDTIGNVPCNGIAKWNGTSWTCLNMPPMAYGVAGDAICVYQNEIYVGGNFHTNLYPNDTIENIIKFDGTHWRSVGGGMHGGMDALSSMAVYNNELYVAGTFRIADGNAGNFIQRWNGTMWRDVGGGMGGLTNAYIWQLKVIHNSLYAVGVFTTAGGITANKIAKWDGMNWCGFGDTILNDNIMAIETYHDSIYIGGGNLIVINSDTIHSIAKWIGGNYTSGCTSMGVEELGIRNEELEICPNPCASQLGIKNEELGIKEVKIYNVMGEVITEKRISTNERKYEMDVSGLAKGLYFLEVRTEKGVRRKKFIKE